MDKNNNKLKRPHSNDLLLEPATQNTSKQWYKNSRRARIKLRQTFSTLLALNLNIGLSLLRINVLGKKCCDKMVSH